MLIEWLTLIACFPVEGHIISHKLWNVEEAQKSSSYRELKAVSLGLESYLPLLEGTQSADTHAHYIPFHT